MGSYLSIFNNTSDVWCVKVGPDEAAINIASITSSVLVAVAATVATAGAAAPVAASLAANGIVSVFGVDAAFLEAATAAAAAVSGETGAVSTAAKFTKNWSASSKTNSPAKASIASIQVSSQYVSTSVVRFFDTFSQ
jgi:hypothetical protein